MNFIRRARLNPDKVQLVISYKFPYGTHSVTFSTIDASGVEFSLKAGGRSNIY